MAFDPLEYEMRRQAVSGNRSSGRAAVSSAGNGPTTMLSNFVDALSEKKQADTALQAEMAKLKLQEQEKKDLMDYQSNLKNNTPQSQFQQMLSRRWQQSNPIGGPPTSTVQIPTADNPDQSVAFDADRVEQTPAGNLTQAPINPEQQKMAFITKYNQMMAAAKNGTGPAPAPAMQAVYQKYFNDVNKIKSTPGLTMEDVNGGGESQPAQTAPKPSGKNIFQQAMDAIMGRTSSGTQQSPPVTSGQDTSQTANSTPSAPKYSVGDPVTYQGKSYKVTGVRDDGSLELG